MISASSGWKEILGFLAGKMSDGVLIFSNTEIVYTNSVWIELCEITQEDIKDAELGWFFDAGELTRVAAAAEQWTGIPGVDAEIEIKLKTRGGSTRTVVASTCRRFVVDNEPVSAIVVRSPKAANKGDREKKVMGDQLWQAQKMEALGTLAGGVAHDMNNILAAIMSLASVLRQDAEPGDPRIDDLNDILAATRRGKDLTQNLLGFARKGKYRKELISLNHVAVQVKELLTRTIPKNIQWQLDLEDRIPSVRGDYGQLSHALMNIAINAADAMPKGGTLTLKTGVVSAMDARAESGLNLEDREYVLLRVTDTGEGMDEETSERAFEPFFSTKDHDKGTGLGLAMVYGTAQNHGGEVNIRSRLAEGTEVSVFLPAAKVKGVDKRTCPNLRAVGPVGTGRILVVDDEDLIRRSVKRVLETLGYTAILASNGQEALEIFENDREITLVILDLTMPVMDGEEAFHKMRAINDRVPVLLLSGHTLEGKAEELLEAGAAAFVQKPFDVQKLSKGILMSIPV